MVRAPPPRLVLSAVGSTIALAQLSTAGERSRRPLKSAPPGRGRICLTRRALSSVRELVLTTAHIPQVSIAESAADRKARLKALRASRDGGDYRARGADGHDAETPSWMPLIVPPSSEVLPRAAPSSMAGALAHAERSLQRAQHAWVRPVRKRCARATGLSGFFSGKKGA